MDVTNYTPWPHFVFESRTPEDDPFGVIVLRGTFRIVPGEALRPIPSQEPVSLSDRHRGEPGRSSLRMESDLAPFKPRTDVHVDAVARAPSGRPSDRWPVRVRLGTVQKDLWVCGPSEWRHHRVGGWRLTRPEPCLEVEMSYENAFGGTVALEDGTLASDPHNPVGTGWIPRGASRDRPIRAPQILANGEPEHRAGQSYAPQGIGPLAPNWQPRLARAGTFDQQWLDTRAPVLPEDFDYAFYNSAHADLTCPAIARGDESVELVNFFADRMALSFELPGYDVVGLVRFDSGRVFPFQISLDTVHIDVSSAELEEHRVGLTWRACFPHTSSISSVEVRMYLPGQNAYTMAMEAELRKLHGPV